MNMKKAMIVLLVLVTGLSGAAFAAGQIEEAQRNAPSARPAWDFEDEDLVKVTGKVSYENRIHPELKDGSTVYNLMVPRMYLYSVELDEGKTVTVEGYLTDEFPGRRPWGDVADDNGQYIAVTKAVIDGKEYELDHPMYGPQFSDDFRGAPRMGGPGTAGRRMPGPDGKGGRWDDRGRRW
jgi:hypothetical protein